METTIAPNVRETTGRMSSSALNNKPDQRTNSDYMRQLLDAQKRAFIAEGKVSAATRMDRLKRIYQMIGNNQQAIIEACQRDFGNRSRHQSQMSEILVIMEGMRKTIKHVEKWMRPEKRQADFPMNLLGARAHVEYQPKGVVGNLSTWNFPVYTAIMPLAGVFAAGNRAMLKLSEVTPEVSVLLQKIIADYFDETECVGIIGGPETGA